MTREILLIILGIWVGLLPYLGFPAGIDTYILSATGALIFFLAIMIHNDNAKRRYSRARKADSFEQSAPASSVPQAYTPSSLTNLRSPQRPTDA
jgi:TRAP-type C4-dicarboxylate transport system permease small subunit